MDTLKKLIEIREKYLGKDHPSLVHLREAARQAELSAGAPYHAPPAPGPGGPVPESQDAYHFQLYEDHPHAFWYAEWWYLNFIDPASGRAGIVAMETLNPGSVGVPGACATTTVVYDPAAGKPMTTLDPHGLVQWAASTEQADVTAADNILRVLDDGTYWLRARTANGRASFDLKYTQAASPQFLGDNANLPGTWEHMSWLVWMPHARVSGTFTFDGVTAELHDVPGYHDHNWGTWRSTERMWVWAQFASPTEDLAFVVPPDLTFTGVKGYLRYHGTEMVFSPQSMRYEPRDWKHWEVFWKYPMAASLRCVDDTGEYKLEIDWKVEENATVWKSILLIFEQRTRFQGTLYRADGKGGWTALKEIDEEGFSEYTNAWV